MNHSCSILLLLLMIVCGMIILVGVTTTLLVARATLAAPEFVGLIVRPDAASAVHPRALQPQLAIPPTMKAQESRTTEINKNPHVGGSTSGVSVMWKRQTPAGANSDGSTAWSRRAVSDGTWQPPQKLGGRGDVTYHTLDVAISPHDQAAHMVWVDTSAGGDDFVFYQRRALDGQAGPVVQLSSAGRFATYPTITAGATNQVWVAWTASSGVSGGEVHQLLSRSSADSGTTGLVLWLLMPWNHSVRRWLPMQRAVCIWPEGATMERCGMAAHRVQDGQTNISALVATTRSPRLPCIRHRTRCLCCGGAGAGLLCGMCLLHLAKPALWPGCRSPNYMKAIT